MILSWEVTELIPQCKDVYDFMMYPTRVYSSSLKLLVFKSCNYNLLKFATRTIYEI
jgi:hypothetical protein